jgi:SAM-dependent methyltransferase
MSGVSTNYRQLEPGEVEQVAAECAEAWKAEMIPIRQYQLAARKELEAYRAGDLMTEPFHTLVNCMRALPVEFLHSVPSLLDVGASGGYYRDVLRIAGLMFRYTGCDFSESFRRLAQELYPDIKFDMADARQLPYENQSFDVVLSGACMMHVREYSKVLSEAARVAKKYVVLHRTPVLTTKPTTFYRKEAYSVPCLECHFNEAELFDLFRENRLCVINKETVFWEPEKSFGHLTYLLEKVA